MLCTIRLNLSSIHLFLPTIKSFITEILGNFFKEYDKSIVTWLRYIKNSQTVKKHILKNTNLKSAHYNFIIQLLFFTWHFVIQYSNKRSLWNTYTPPLPLPPLETLMKKMNRKCIWLEFFFKSKECNSVENGSLPKIEVDLDIIMINL